MDCSVTKRKGCNYCLRAKDIYNTRYGHAFINDEHKTIGVLLGDDSHVLYSIEIIINYCPICGKEL